MRKILIAIAKVIAPFPKVELHEIELLKPPAIINAETRLINILSIP